tara:strand:- start:246 stop:647 length:402 start_codon:yes stop_codon:yes gene_type:complete
MHREMAAVHASKGGHHEDRGIAAEHRVMAVDHAPRAGHHARLPAPRLQAAGLHWQAHQALRLGVDCLGWQAELEVLLREVVYPVQHHHAKRLGRSALCVRAVGHDWEAALHALRLGVGCLVQLALRGLALVSL